MEITFLPQTSANLLPKSGVLVLAVTEGKSGGTLVFSGAGKEIDKKTGGQLIKAAKQSDFSAKKGTSLAVVAPHGLQVNAVLLMGLGKLKDYETAFDWQKFGANLYRRVDNSFMQDLTVVLDESLKGQKDADIVASIASGVLLASYRFDKYFTKKNKKDDEPKKHPETLKLLTQDAKRAMAAFEEENAVVKSVFAARDYVSEPPNVLYPESYAKRVQELFKGKPVTVEVLGVKEMQKLGMGSLLGVGQGSIRESRLVVMQYHGGKKTEKPLGFVGKGVTFDTGGISIKPANGMEDMKYDMAGSAAVVGTIHALATRKAKVNAVGVIGLVENMPDGNAQRPSDIVTSMSGQTIEVLNTDAEGRLVLADALWYTQDRFKPQFMVNLATLTGAIVVSLGSEYAGLFSNNDKLSERLTKSGEAVGEKLWRFPMGKEYDKQIDSKVADMQNIGNAKGAGSITAAQFLQRFVNDTPWAHLDIAGVAWAGKPKDVFAEGASGYGVRLLNQLVKDHYE